MDGTHVVANLYRCQGERRYLVDAGALRQICLEAIERAGLTILGDLFHEFPGGDGSPEGSGGVTGCVVLAESHVAIHTWPEIASVALDVYVCNYSQDNSSGARQVVDDLTRLLAPEDCVRHDLPRDRQYLYEYLNEDHGFFVRASKRLGASHTGVQALEVHETPQFGRTLRLDGCFMGSEKEEFVYHENMIHPAATAHAAPKRILIVGGGDGGLAEEALKHPSVEQVTLVELDPQVIEIAKRHFASVHRGVFEHPKLRVVVDDGLKFVAATGVRFDVIALDLPDPLGPAAALYQAPFLRSCRRALAPGGALVLHMGSPWARPDRVGAIYRRLAKLFKIVRPYTMFIPLYGSLWSMAVCSDSLDPMKLPAAEVDKRIAARRLRDLRYYNGGAHQAVFALPNFMRDLLGRAVKAVPEAKRRAA